MLCKINPSKSLIKNIPDETLVSFVDMPSVSNDGYIAHTDIKPLGELRKGSYTYFADGDVIIAKISPSMENGKCAVAKNLTGGIAMGSSEFHVLRPGNEILPEYLLGYLNRESIRNEAARHMTGASGHRRVPIEFYEDMDIPVLSIDEQRKIVEEVHSYQIEMQKARDILNSCEAKKNDIINKYLYNMNVDSHLETI